MSVLLTVVAIGAMTMLGLNALLAWAFVLRYQRVNWRKYPEGRHLMRFTFVLAVIFTLTFVLTLAPVPPLVGASVSLVLFTASAVELGNRLRLERDAQLHRNPSTKETSMTETTETTPTAPTPTQVRRPWRATVRTAFAAVVAGAAMAGPVYEAATHQDPAAATGLAATGLGICLGITRVMALPGVNGWIERFVPWLAAEPKR